MSAPSNAIPVISASALTVSFGAQTLLAEATLALHLGERVGLVGRNGCGKSTFLDICAGVLEPDGGEVTRQRDLLTGHLPQDFDLDPAATVGANILAGAQHILDIIAEYEAAPATTHGAELLDEIERHDGWNLDSRLRSLVTNLHAPPIERRVEGLSGGEQRRVALCRALIAQPDFLILDEPTNHLDTESVEWLETFLRSYAGTCLFVTHDRFFLDRVASRIVELKGGRFHSYPGNYSAYLATRAERDAADETLDAKRQKFLAKELEWVRRGPSARRTKSVDRIARYYEMAAQGGLERESDVDLVIPPPPKLGNRVLDLRGIGLDLGGRTLFDKLDLELPAGARVGLVGRNGVGKTSLLRIILGQLKPTRGEVLIGTRTVINYVDQNRALLDDNDTVLSAIAGRADWVVLGENRLHVRSYLRRFLFSDEAINSKVGQLSGGERSRLTLAKILLRGGNLIILDEPTNDLDLSTLQILEEGLADFPGCVLLVSHDRWFLNRVCTHILSFGDDARVEFTPGDYDYYVEKRASAVVEKAPAKAAEEPRKARARKLSYKETRELEGIQAEIEAAEREATETEALLADPQFFVTRFKEFPAFEAKLAAARTRAAERYARWEELEAIRAATA